jgi:uncharacterized protein (DUF305 family)
MPRFRTLAAGSLLMLVGASAAEAAAQDGFHQAMDAAMDRMMAAMHARPSKDVDRDFVLMMVPHHQGAIDMAVAELRYGTNPRLKRIAQEIIIEQQQEIAAMNLTLGEPLPAAGPAKTQACPPLAPRTL